MAGWMDRYADKLQNQKDKFLNTRNNQLADRIINLIFSSTYEWKKIVSKRNHLNEQPRRPFKESGRLCWKYFNQQPDAWELGLWGSAGKCSIAGAVCQRWGACSYQQPGGTKVTGPEEAIYPSPPPHVSSITLVLSLLPDCFIETCPLKVTNDIFIANSNGLFFHPVLIIPRSLMFIKVISVTADTNGLFLKLSGFHDTALL